MNLKATSIYFQLKRQCRLAHDVLVLVGISFIFGRYFYVVCNLKN